MDGARRDLLGSQLASLVEEVGVPLVDIAVITGLPTDIATRASFRLEFRNGLRLKGRRFDDEKNAERVHVLSRLLDPEAFSRVLHWRGSAIIEEWIDGEVMPWTQFRPEQVRMMGHRLGEVHATRLHPDIMRTYGTESRTGPDYGRYLERLGRHLREMGTLTSGQFRIVQGCARTALPDSVSRGLLHGDFAPENMVIDENERIVVVDNGSIRVGAFALDLARVWYRWPLDDTNEAHFLDGYAAAHECSEYEDRSYFWKMLALAEAAHFRMTWQTENSGLPLARLHDLLASANEKYVKNCEQPIISRRVD